MGTMKRTRSILLLAFVPGMSSPALAQDYQAAVRDLRQAELSRNVEAFSFAAKHLLKDDSERAVREVLESYGRFASSPNLDPALHYRLHSELAKALSDVESPPGRGEIIQQRKRSRSWEVRVLCLDASSFRPEPLKLREGAIDMLRDKSPMVVRRALDYLKNDRRLMVVDAVLERFLEIDGRKGPRGNEWDRVRLAFRTALTSLVQVSLPAAVDYRGYVETRRDRPEELFDRPPPERGPTRLTIFGAEVTGDHIAFVIDVSGSMLSTDPIEIPLRPGLTETQEKTRAREAKMIEERRRITRAKRELTKVVRGLPKGKKFNIIAYSTDVVPWKKLLTPVKDSTRQDAVEFIAGLKAQGITVTDEALEAAFTDLSVDTIYLITDGAPTHVGVRGPGMPPDAENLIRRILRRVREINYFRGVRVFTLGFPEAEEDFLKKLSADNGGKYTPIR